MDIIDQQRKDYIVSRLRNRLDKQTGYIFWAEKRFNDINLNYPFDGKLDKCYKELQETWVSLLKIRHGDKLTIDITRN